jgi:hypothetical protein
LITRITLALPDKDNDTLPAFFFDSKSPMVVMKPILASVLDGVTCYQKGIKIYQKLKNLIKLF